MRENITISSISSLKQVGDNGLMRLRWQIMPGSICKNMRNSTLNVSDFKHKIEPFYRVQQHREVAIRILVNTVLILNTRYKIFLETKERLVW